MSTSSWSPHVIFVRSAPISIDARKHCSKTDLAIVHTVDLRGFERETVHGGFASPKMKGSALIVAHRC